MATIEDTRKMFAKHVDVDPNDLNLYLIEEAIKYEIYKVSDIYWKVERGSIHKLSYDRALSLVVAARLERL